MVTSRFGNHTTPEGNVTDAFASLMVRFAAAYPTSPVGAATIKVYARALGDLPIERVEQAFLVVIRESKFFPTIAEIRSRLSPPLQEAAVLAFAALRQAAEDVGAYASIEIDDACAARALLASFGTWPSFCEFEDGPALHTRRQEFIAAYADARRTPHPVSAVRMPGRCELTGEYRGGSNVFVGRLLRSGKSEFVRDVPKIERILPSGSGDGIARSYK